MGILAEVMLLNHNIFLIDLLCLSEIDRSKIDHRFSIGLRSGLCDGQSSRGICISCIARCVLIAVTPYTWDHCILYYWNVQFLPWNRRSADLRTAALNMSMYWCWSIIPSISTSSPTPWAAKHPHTIIFSSRLTLPVIAKAQFRSEDSLQHLVFWQNLNTNGDSSDQRKLDHCSIV